MKDRKRPLMPNMHNGEGETRAQRRARQVELEGIRELEAEEARNDKERRMAGSEDDSRSGGASLQMGSTEYREMIYDHQGMDEFEQEKAESDRLGTKREDDFDPVDKTHAELQQKLADERPKAKAYREAHEDGRLSTAERKVSHQVRKAGLVDDVKRVAGRYARGTETTADDDYVKRKLPDVLEDGVYDDGETEDDFYPGSRTIEKYL